MARKIFMGRALESTSHFGVSTAPRRLEGAGGTARCRITDPAACHCGDRVSGRPRSVVVAHPELADELLLHVRRHRLVVRELDGVAPLPARQRVEPALVA